MTTHETLPERDTSRMEPTEPLAAYTLLTQIEAVRQQQLDTLPPTDQDAVAAAYRASIERILEEVRTARRRAMAGLHGICATCSEDISVERLELRPWATTCARCARRSRY